MHCYVNMLCSTCLYYIHILCKLCYKRFFHCFQRHWVAIQIPNITWLMLKYATHRWVVFFAVACANKTLLLLKKKSILEFLNLSTKIYDTVDDAEKRIRKRVTYHNMAFFHVHYQWSSIFREPGNIFSYGPALSF